MARSPFEFLDSNSKERTLLLLLLAIVKKQGGELELSLADLTAVADGDCFIRYPGDTGTSLMLRFARRGAEVYFLTEAASSATKPYRPLPAEPKISEVKTENLLDPNLPLSLPSRHSVQSDQGWALREQEMAEHAAAISKQRMNEARAKSGALPWRTVKTQ